MNFTEISINALENVTIASELITSGGGNYYRNRINFHLKVAEDLTEEEAKNFTTELRYSNREWEVRLIKGLPERTPPIELGPKTSFNNLILEEEVDMALEDFSNIHYRFPLESGVATVSFLLENGKVRPLVTRH